MVSLSTVCRLSLQFCRLRVTRGGERAVSRTRLCLRGIRWLSLLCRSEGQFPVNIALKDCWEHCKILRWWSWLVGSQPLRWRWKFSGRNNTIGHTHWSHSTYMMWISGHRRHQPPSPRGGVYFHGRMFIPNWYKVAALCGNTPIKQLSPIILTPTLHTCLLSCKP